MGADIRKQLIEALDNAAGQIDPRGDDDPQRAVQLKIRGAWRFMDHSVGAGLIHRDRALLADLQAVEAECSDAEAGATPPEVRPLMVTGVERRVLREQLERAAAFWLGTPEVDR